jgi:hypothetical protein
MPGNVCLHAGVGVGGVPEGAGERCRKSVCESDGNQCESQGIGIGIGKITVSDRYVTFYGIVCVL